MKIIHTSDWHVGQNLKRYDRDDEHAHFFSQLAAFLTEHRPDALVVSGDIYHTSAPAASATRTLIEGVISLHDASPETVIVITAGNHDSGVRLDAQRQLWHRLGIHVIGSCRRREDGTFDPAQYVVDVNGKGFVLASPYFNSSNYPLAHPDAREVRQKAYYQALIDQVNGQGLPVVLMAHLAVTGCNTLGHEDMIIGGMDQQDLDELGCGYDYLALGHIHKPQTLSQRAYYCGSPLPVSFSEDYPHYVNLVDIPEHGAIPSVTQIEVAPLRRVVTLPPFGGTDAEALILLEQFPADDNSYIRLLIDQAEPLAIDYEERVRLIVDGKACRYCEIRFKPRAMDDVVGGQLKIKNVQEFEQLNPLDIAKNYYLRAKGTEMSPVLVEMMENVIAKVNDGNTES